MCVFLNYIFIMLPINNNWSGMFLPKRFDKLYYGAPWVRESLLFDRIVRLKAMADRAA